MIKSVGRQQNINILKNGVCTFLHVFRCVANVLRGLSAYRTAVKLKPSGHINFLHRFKMMVGIAKLMLIFTVDKVVTRQLQGPNRFLKLLVIDHYIDIYHTPHPQTWVISLT